MAWGGELKKFHAKFSDFKVKTSMKSNLASK